MLTRELLVFRTRDGQIRPAFVDVAAPALRELAEALVALAGQSASSTAGALGESLQTAARGFPNPRVAQGLIKLVQDRLQVAEPDPSLSRNRWEIFFRAAGIRRDLPPGASPADYEAALTTALPGPLEPLREGLYRDLPEHRIVLGWLPLSAQALLERYNLALAQGHLLQADRVTLTARAPELLRVRRVLRWLKFCRLVAEVRREGAHWSLEIEGPAALLSMQKRYGLQLATFLPIAPLLERWELVAQCRTRKGLLSLRLSQDDGLVCPYLEALGHIPQEVQQVASAFEDDAWALELQALPRHVGVTGTCVPDLLFRHRTRGTEVAFELFHPWHAAPLERRLEQLAQRPDPTLFLGVDRALAKAAPLKEQLAGHPQVMLFSSYPAVSKLRTILGSVPA